MEVSKNDLKVNSYRDLVKLQTDKDFAQSLYNFHEILVFRTFVSHKTS